MRLKLNSTVKLTVIDGEGVLLNVTDGTYFGVDEIGTEIIQAMKNEKPLSEIVEKNAEKYGVNKEEVEKDFATFIEELKKCNLVSDHNV